MNFNQTRNIIIFGILVLLLIQWKACSYYKDDRDSQSDYISTLNDSLKTYKTTNGKLIAEARAVTINSNTFENIIKENNNLKQKLKDAGKISPGWKRKL